MPDATLSTDIIVGFPGETDRDFRETLTLIEETQFDWGFIFKYSPREGTPAASLESLPQELVEERHQECLALIDRCAQEKRSKMVGTMQDVLVEADNIGRTRTNYRVYITGNVAPGEEVRGRVNVHTMPIGLLAKTTELQPRINTNAHEFEPIAGDLPSFVCIRVHSWLRHANHQS